jgi:SAM-dependent methyltransferase
MDIGIEEQYATGLTVENVQRAVAAVGLDLEAIRPGDLAMIEDFHTLGRIATAQLLDLVPIRSGDRVLDAGCGIGGTARYLADRFGCRVTAVDLTAEYVEAAAWLNRLVGLADRIDVQLADVTDLPFPDGSFQAVVSQHVQMNVADKARLYREARRVLAPGGHLGVWDVTTSAGAEPAFPLPWSDRPDTSHLVTAADLRSTIEAAGFDVVHWADLTEPAADFMRDIVAIPPGRLGLHAFVPDFATKLANLTDALSDGRLRVVQGVARTEAGD